MPQMGHQDSTNDNGCDLLSSYSVWVLKVYHHQSYKSPVNQVLLASPDRRANWGSGSHSGATGVHV